MTRASHVARTKQLRSTRALTAQWTSSWPSLGLTGYSWSVPLRATCRGKGDPRLPVLASLDDEHVRGRIPVASLEFPGSVHLGGQGRGNICPMQLSRCEQRTGDLSSPPSGSHGRSRTGSSGFCRTPRRNPSATSATVRNRSIPPSLSSSPSLRNRSRTCECASTAWILMPFAASSLATRQHLRGVHVHYRHFGQIQHD